MNLVDVQARQAGAETVLKTNLQALINDFIEEVTRDLRRQGLL